MIKLPDSLIEKAYEISIYFFLFFIAVLVGYSIN